MGALIFWQILAVVVGAVSEPASAPVRSAPQIVAEYLALPIPVDFDAGKARGERLQTLRQLTTIPDEAVPVIAATLPTVQREVHRQELIEILGRLPTAASAELLVSLLEDPAPAVRSRALSSLRLLACRIHRSGVVHVPRGPDFPPEVAGLVPHLVMASEDEDEGVRALALWALADTREPAAQEALRARLADPSARVRFRAACLLTEFGDSSGLPELRAWLPRFTAETDAHAATHYEDARHLIVAFERVTGVSLGESPRLPVVLSTSTAQSESAREFEALLRSWDAWWAARDAEER